MDEGIIYRGNTNDGSMKGKRSQRKTREGTRKQGEQQVGECYCYCLVLILSIDLIEYLNTEKRGKDRGSSV